LGYVHKLNQKNQRKYLTFSRVIHTLSCYDNDDKEKLIMDMGTFAMGCMNYELTRDAGNLPEHDIEFQNETGIGPTYNNNEPMTDEEWREALEEDGRMTPEEIDEYIDSFHM
jgi:hypothetical protein